MKSVWLQKTDSKKLFIFCLGWGMDENVISHLKSDEADILAVYDYRDMVFVENLNEYDDITLLAWSMGVLAAGVLAQNISIAKAIAINGTQCLLDEKFGIHPKAYQLTIDNFSEKVRDVFFENMFFDGKEKDMFNPPKRDLQDQKQELEYLQKMALSGVGFDFEFDCAIISSRDKIIPFKNQKRFWQTKKVKVVELDCGHFPFFKFNYPEEILHEALQ